MRVLEYMPKFNIGEDIATILAGSCWHIGNDAVHIKGINNFLAKAKKHSWILHGDVIEGVTPFDKRYEKDAHEASLVSTIQKAADLIKEAQSNCIGLLKGNHEDAPSKTFGDVAEDIAMRAGVPYLTATCFIKFVCPAGQFTGFFAHGNGSANYRTGEPERKKSNKQIKLRDILKDFHADICGMGHLHKSISTAPCSELRLSVGEDNTVKRRPIVTRPGWFYAAPSMFKTYNGHKSNYGEMKIFPAVDLGWIEFDVNRQGEILEIREVNEEGVTLETTRPTVIR